MIKNKTIYNDQIMPSIGFGTWELSPDDIAEATVSTAIQVGYRLIDTARIYDNEVGVGRAIRKSGIDRKELFVTTKLWNDDQGYESALSACDESLKRLGLDYLDLYLIHWPATSRRLDSWRALTELQKRGKIRSIGVSNYTVRHLEEILDSTSVIPAVNQIEFHPFIYEQQKEILAFCHDNDIVVEAYSPLARMTPRTVKLLGEVASKLGKTPAQVSLRWCIQHGTVPLPRSRNPIHIKSNLEVFDFEIDDEAMQFLDSISDGERVTWDPAEML